MAKFTMLIGLPAAGKTTIAHQLPKLTVGNAPIILSSENIREELKGDLSSPSTPSKVYELMLQRSISALNAGKNVVYDATNCNRKKRVAILRRLPDCEKIAIIVWAQREACAARGVGRNLVRMLKQFQTPYYDEGWNTIKIVYTSELYTYDSWQSWMKCIMNTPGCTRRVGEHTANVAQAFREWRLANEPLPPEFADVLGHAILLHDSGKDATKSYACEARGRTSLTSRFYRHENVGSYLALGFAPTLLQHSNLGEQRLPPTPLPHPQQNIDELLLVSWLVNHHMDSVENSKYYRGLGEGIEKRLLDILRKCDAADHGVNDL